MIKATVSGILKPIRLLLLLLLFVRPALAQTTPSAERLRLIDERLRNLAITVPGLDQKVQLAVSGVSAQEFLRALAQAANLNLNIDPQLTFRVVNNFTNETPRNILLFLARENELDINLIGSIISIVKVPAPRPVIVPREIRATYDARSDALSLELNNDTLLNVAKKITQVSQKNIVVPQGLSNARVTAFFAATPFETALGKLAYGNNLKLVKTADNVYVFQALAEGEELYITPEGTTAVRRVSRPASPGAAGSSANVTGKNSPGGRLISADVANAPIADLVKSAANEAGVNYFIYSDIRGNITARVRDVNFPDFLGSIFQATEFTYRVENGVYLIGDRKLEGLRTNRVIKLKYRSIDTVVAMIPTEWRKGVEIKEFKEQNTLLLSGSSPQISEIESYIRQIDELVPMVLIEVTLLDVRKGHSVKTGISAGVSDSVKTGGTLLPGMDYTFGAASINDFLNRLGKNSSVNIGRVAPNFYVKLSALEDNNNVEIRSVPKLSTLNGHTATLSIGSKRYYSQRTQNVIPSLTTQTVITEQFTPIEANLNIMIRPVVSGDDQVTLNIKVDISDFIGTPPNNAPPPTSTSKFESIVRAKGEDMIVLGGLERTENSETGSGVPLLARIPVIKWFFSRKEKAASKVVTIVFIKPTIIYN